MKKPNILLLMTDQHNARCMSWTGEPLLRTPAMDRLAEDGVRFTNAFANSIHCGPSRISFLTGMYEHEHKRHPECAHTSPLPAEHAPEVWCGKETVSYLRRDRPFFAFISFEGPHDPLSVPSPFDVMYDPKEVRLPANTADTLAIGLAKLKRDRWAAIEPVFKKGVLQTRPMYWANRTLSINAEVEDGGSIRAELLDIWGKPISGFTARESDGFCGDSFGHTLSWRGCTEVPEDRIGSAYWEGDQDGSGRVMSIRFYLELARLYSFSC